MMRLALVLCLVLIAGAASALAPLKPGARIAFLGVQFIDTSTEGDYFGVREDEAARILLVESAIRGRFEAEGFVLVDTEPVAGELERTSNIAACYGCEVRMARQLGADYSLVGAVQKVSNLILAMNLVLRDADSGTAVRGLAVDVRSNTDDSWLRGVDYILRNHYFAE